MSCCCSGDNEEVPPVFEENAPLLPSEPPPSFEPPGCPHSIHHSPGTLIWNPPKYSAKCTPYCPQRACDNPHDERGVYCTPPSLLDGRVLVGFVVRIV